MRNNRRTRKRSRRRRQRGGVWSYLKSWFGKKDKEGGTPSPPIDLPPGADSEVANRFGEEIDARVGETPGFGTDPSRGGRRTRRRRKSRRRGGQDNITGEHTGTTIPEWLLKKAEEAGLDTNKIQNEKWSMKQVRVAINAQRAGRRRKSRRRRTKRRRKSRRRRRKSRRRRRKSRRRRRRK